MNAVIKSDQVAAEWPRLAGFIESAMSQSLGETAESLREAAIRDEAQLWDLGRGAAVTRIVRTANKRVLHIVAVGGCDKDDAIVGEVLDAFEQFARSAHCNVIFASGRPGWRRDLVRHGFHIEKLSAVREVTYA